MTFKRFEDIEGWKLARQLCKRVRDITEREPFAKDWTLRNQIKASSGSTMDCIAEGFERGSTNEFVYFLGVSKGSCGESRSQLYRAFDHHYIDQQELDELLSLAFRINAAAQGLIEYLNKTEIKGTRSHGKDEKKKDEKKKKKSYIGGESDRYFPNSPPPGI